MVLRQLQSLLGRVYDVPSHYDVYDFLVTDRLAVAALKQRDDQGADQGATEEELLLAETADGAGVSLYLDERLLKRLETADPFGALTEKNLADYCTALEGVSHFVYSTWRLGSDAPVSLLELETQAEVDKFVATIFLVADQTDGSYPAQVHARLFDRVSYKAGLAPDEVHRYRTAHRSAAGYCRKLERRFVNRGQVRIEAMVRELRKFYRLGSAAKLHYATA